jgi:energy-coupling factor transporter ATP-binding protein EcfA2
MLWIGLTGYSGVGKSTVAQILTELEPRFTQASVSLVIKRHADPILRKYTGISAFTEDRREKEAIRGFILYFGYHNYQKLFEEFKLQAIDQDYLINPRVFTWEEAMWWKGNGGVIWEVVKPFVGPTEPKEEEELNKLIRSGLIDTVIVNDGSLDDLRAKVAEAYLCLLNST